MKNIVWLASYPSSGNTWFRILLENLFSDKEAPVNINELKLATHASSRKLFDEYAGINSSDLTPDEIRKLQPLVYKTLSEASEEILFLKTHDAWSLNKNNQPLFPPEVTKGVIYLIRNPVDVAISISFQSGLSVKQVINNMIDSKYGLCNSPRSLVKQLDQQITSWNNHIESWTKRSQLPIHIIKYEDLLKDTNKTFKKALDFIEIRYSNSKVEQAIKNSAFQVVKSQENDFGFKEKQIQSRSFFNKGSKYELKNRLDQEDLLRLYDSSKSMLTEFNYEIF